MTFTIIDICNCGKIKNKIRIILFKNIFNFWIIAFIKLEHTITKIPKIATTNSTVLMDMIYELLINKLTPTQVAKIQSNTIREVFNFLNWLLNLTVVQRWIMVINTLLLSTCLRLLSKKSLYFSTVNNRVTFSDNDNISNIGYNPTLSFCCNHDCSLYTLLFRTNGIIN